MWYQNSFLLDQSDRRSMESKGDRHAMLIRNFQTSDFGNYRYVCALGVWEFVWIVQMANQSIPYRIIGGSCVADNALGRTKKYIEISGRPGPAEFISPMFSGSLEYYNLTWSVESIPPLEEIRLLYRKLMVCVGRVSGGFGGSSLRDVLYSMVGADERNVPAPGQVARRRPEADGHTVGRQQFHYVACDPRIRALLGVRGHRAGKESIRLE